MRAGLHRSSVAGWSRLVPVLILCLVVCWFPWSSSLDAQPEPGQVSAPIELSGTLHVVWGDPHPESTSAGVRTAILALPDGRMLPLRLGALESEVLSLANRQVSVRGRMGEELLVVESMSLDAGATQSPQSVGAAVTGTRRVIYLLVRFSGDAVPHPPSWYLNFNNPDTPPTGELFPTTINGFYKKSSWDQFSWLADVGGVGGVGAPGGWLTLPGSKSYYANCGFSSVCAQLSLLSNDAITLGKAAGINFTAYDNINFVLSNDLDCCAWGGGWSFDGKSYGATWEPPWGQEADTYSHEFGHSLGLPHSGWYYFAYDSPWDTMSAHTRELTQACGTYSSANAGVTRTIYCSTPGAGLISAYKELLGWIPPANIVTTDTVSNSNTLLEGLSLPLSGAAKMIKICLPGFSCDPTVSTARYFTVEARVKSLGTPSQYDNGIPGDGVLIHEVRRNRPAIGGACFFNSQSGWAVPVDADPGDYNSALCNTSGFPAPAALFDAQFVPGQTYVNAQYGFNVVVGNRAGNVFDVTVEGAPAKAVMTTPVPGTTIAALSTTFDWTAGSGALQYWLYVGKSGAGSHDVFSKDMGLLQTRWVSGLPGNGNPLYVRLWTRFASGWQYNDYTYATVVVDTGVRMTSPVPGTTLAGASQTFSWTAGTGVLQHWLYVGSSKGTYQYGSFNMGLARTRTVNGLPVDGSTIYVRLWTRYVSGWQYTDYTYSAATAGIKAELTSPSPGSTLTGSAVTFDWSAGTNALQYWIYVGTSGAGSHNIFSKDMGLLLTRWVSGLPTDGGTIYFRLWTRFPAGWQYIDYTYTAKS